MNEKEKITVIEKVNGRRIREIRAHLLDRIALRARLRRHGVTG